MGTEEEHTLTHPSSSQTNTQTFGWVLASMSTAKQKPSFQEQSVACGSHSRAMGRFAEIFRHQLF